MAATNSHTALRATAGCATALALALAFAAPANAAYEPGTIYGSLGATGAAGEVPNAEGIGVDPISGRVALPDYGNDRVSVFAPGGVFLFAFGKDVVPGGGTGPEVCTTVCKAGVEGSGPGELDDPEDAEFSWQLVADPQGSEIVGYEIVVGCEEPDFIEYVAQVGPDVTSVTVSPEILGQEDANECKWEVLAIEASGNQTLTESEFSIE